MASNSKDLKKVGFNVFGMYLSGSETFLTKSPGSAPGSPTSISKYGLAEFLAYSPAIKW